YSIHGLPVPVSDDGHGRNGAIQRSSEMTLPSFGSELAATSSTLPPSFVTARSVAESSSLSASLGDAHAAFSVITSLSPSRVTTRRKRSSPGWRLPISAICSGRTNMPLTLVVWSPRPIQPLIGILLRAHGL